MITLNNPYEVSLETLFGDAYQKNQETENTTPFEDVTNTILDDDNIEENIIQEPHIRIQTKHLENILKISTLLATTGMGSMDSKSVCMDVQEGYINFLLTDAIKTNVERKVPLLNTENQFKGTIVFATSVLAKVIKVCSSTFTLIERKENDKNVYVLKILGGEMYLDNLNNVGIDNFKKSYDEKTLQPYNSNTICNIFKKTFNYVNSAIKDKRMYEFSNGIIQAYPHGSAVKCDCNEKFPNFNMILVDAKLLYTLATNDSSENIKINADGTVFAGDNYSLIVAKVDNSKCAYNNIIDRMFLGESVLVDTSHLVKITELSYGLEYSSGNINFNYTKKGSVSCEVLTKRRNSVVELKGTPNTNVSALEKPIEISSVNLKNVLSIFSGDVSVNMRISTDGISFESSNIKAVVLGRGVGR